MFLLPLPHAFKNHCRHCRFYHCSTKLIVLTMFRKLFVILCRLYRVIRIPSLFDLMENASPMRRGNNSPLDVVFIIIDEIDYNL